MCNPNIVHAAILEKEDGLREYAWETADIKYYCETLGYAIVGYADIDLKNINVD